MAETWSVVIRRPITITTKTGSKDDDLVETYHNCTWEQVQAYRKKFPEPAVITIENRKGAPSPRKFEIEAAGHTTRDEPVVKRSKTTSVVAPSTDTYAELVNKMVKEGA